MLVGVRRDQIGGYWKAWSIDGARCITRGRGTPTTGKILACSAVTYTKCCNSFRRCLLFQQKHLFWRRWSSFWSFWGWPTTGSSGPPLDQRQNFDPVVGHPHKTRTTWDRRMKHTSPESSWRMKHTSPESSWKELSGDVCFILLSHVVAEIEPKMCVAETAETSWWPATGSLLYFTFEWWWCWTKLW